ncbi:MAG TPA: DUF4342 domain-containing protein [Candidatus Limnocylindrales bacterium]|nr:DUF4342 domain-containing protein [Candidatus Limnocylindrales bacterium]
MGDTTIMAEEKTKRTTDESGRPFSEQLEVAGEELAGRVKNLVQQGNVRRLIIRSADGKILLQFPLTLGVVVGGGLLFFYPILAVVSVVGGLVARVNIEIIRDADDVSELSVNTSDVVDKVENVAKDVSKRLERAASNVQETVETEVNTAKRKINDADTDNDLQA